MTRGVLYFSWGDIKPVLERSIASLQHWHPELPYTVVELPAESTYLDKAKMFNASPYEVTAYLDADTIVMGSLDFAFEKAEKHGLACCINEAPWARRYSCLDGDVVEYNAGVMFFDKTISRPVFEAWLECVDKIDSSTLFQTAAGERKQLVNDQAALAKVLEETGFLPFILPMNWNFRPIWQKVVAGNVKIWHDYADPPRALVAFTESQSESRKIQFLSLADSPRPEPKGSPKRSVKVACAMSVPRLTFSDNFFSITEALTPLGIKPCRFDGVFWGQCLERVLEQQLDADWILTIDYDSAFKRIDVERLIKLAAEADFVDGLAAMQMKRRGGELLAAVAEAHGKHRTATQMDRDEFDKDVMRVDTAHFGLTLLRTEALRKLPKPWFLEQPNEEGTWGQGRVDPDIYFWRKWKEAGNSLYLANRIAIGHIEPMITWPDENLEPLHQHVGEFWSQGKPEAAWQ